MWLFFNSLFFELELTGSGLGLMIFQNVSPRTHHKFSNKNTALSAKILNVNGCYLRELSLAVFVTYNTHCNFSLFLLCLKHKSSA